MVVEGKQKCDGRTVVPQHNKLSAQWEHIIAVIADGDEELRLCQAERPAKLLATQPFAK